MNEAAEMIAALVSDPTRADDLPLEKIAPIMAQLAAMQVGLATRLISGGLGDVQPQHDELLTIEQAEQRLGFSKDWLYRHSRQLPFTVRQGRLLRFSARGIDSYIRRKQGSALASRTS